MSQDTVRSSVGSSTDGSGLRADARRNREGLLVTAADLFSEQGTDVPLEEVARRAGVGVGTLYRHFPNRNALIEGVYRREVAVLCDQVEGLLAEHADEPDLALEQWMLRFTGYVARKRGMALALKNALGTDSALFVETRQRLFDSLTALVGAASAAGTIRGDVDVDDLMRAVGGICMATDEGWQDRSARLVALLMDGLRFGAPVHAPA